MVKLKVGQDQNNMKFMETESNGKKIINKNMN